MPVCGKRAGKSAAKHAARAGNDNIHRKFLACYNVTLIRRIALRLFSTQRSVSSFSAAFFAEERAVHKLFRNPVAQHTAEIIVARIGKEAAAVRQHAGKLPKVAVSAIMFNSSSMPRLWSQNHHAAPGTTPLKLPAVVASAIYIEGSSVYKIVCGSESLRSIVSKSTATSRSGIGSPTQSPPASGPTVSNSRVHALRFTFRCSCIVTLCALYSCAKYTYISNRKLRNSFSGIVFPFSAFFKRLRGIAAFVFLREALNADIAHAAAVLAEEIKPL